MAADHAAGLLVSHSSRVFAYELTRGFARRILLLSRRCRTTPLRFALRCMRTEFSVGAPRARHDRTLSHPTCFPVFGECVRHRTSTSTCSVRGHASSH